MKLSKLIEYLNERLESHGDCIVSVMQEQVDANTKNQTQYESDVTDVAWTGKSVVIIGQELF